MYPSFPEASVPSELSRDEGCLGPLQAHLLLWGANAGMGRERAGKGSNCVHPDKETAA